MRTNRYDDDDDSEEENTNLLVLPKLDNEADISITPDGGFSGFTSNVEFYNYVLNPQDVWDIYSRGYGGSLLGNILGRYRAKLAFYEDNVETASLNF